MESKSSKLFKRIPCTGRLVLNSGIPKMRCVRSDWKERKRMVRVVGECAIDIGAMEA